MWKYLRCVFKVIPNLFKILFFNMFHHNFIKYSRVKLLNFTSNQMRSVSKKIGVKYIVTGKENLPNEQSYLITPNHQAAFDAVAMLSMFENEPMAFVAKKELRHTPLVGNLNACVGSLFMDRSNIKSELKTMLKVKKSLENENMKWVIFPEGTRTKDPNFKLGEFKSGVYKFPMSLNKKIVPCAIYGTKRVLSFKDNHYEYPLYIHFFEPITPEFYKDKSTQEVSAYIQNMIQEKVDEFIKIDNEKKHR